MSEINYTEEIPEDILCIHLKIIDKYEWKYSSLKNKYKMCTYQKGYFRGGSNININIITCEDKIFTPSMPQSYVLYWYHTYLLHPGMDRTEAMICQHL